MKYTLNNRPDEIDQQEITISEVIELKSFTFPRVVVKLNGQLIKKPQFPETIVTEGDHLEVIHLISGG